MVLHKIFYLFLTLLLIVSCNGKNNHDDGISLQTADKTIHIADTLKEKLVPESFETKPVLSGTDTTNYSELREYLIQLDDFYMENRHLRDSILPDFWKLCPLYYDLLRDDREKRKEQFLKIFKEVPKHNGVNYAFLEEIIASNDSTLFSYQKPLGAILYGITNSTAIFEDKLNRGYQAEKSFFEEIKDHEDTIVEQDQMIESTTQFPIKERQDSVYVYTKMNRYKTSVNTFNYHSSSCGSYYFYEIGEVEKPESELTLISSPMPIELEYYWDEELDKIIMNRFQEVCADCPSSGRFQKTFARLKGYDNFYFTYTREPRKETDDTYVPQRSLIYYNGELFYTVWSMKVDTFGCSCL